MSTGTSNAPHKNQCSTSTRFFKDMFYVSILFVMLPCLTHGQEAKFASFIRDTHIEYAITCSPDGRNVYAAGIHTIVVFEHQADGTLKSQQVLNNDHLGIRDVHNIIDLAVSPDGRHLYAVSCSNQSLLVFSRDPTTGNIQSLHAIIDEVFAGQYGLLPGGELFHNLMISPNGKYLYWLYNTYDNRGVLAVFERDSNSGQVAKIQVLMNGDLKLGPYNVPRWMAISPDGKHLYGGGGNNTKILIFACEMETGTIVHVAFYDPAPSSPAGNWDKGGISISPDGLNLCVTDVFADKIRILTRNFFDGGLELLQTIGANSPRNLLISPDGDQFYFVHYDQARYFALYEKDSQTGQLIAMNEYELKIENGIDTWARMSSLGDGIYMTTIDQGLTVIQRDTSTGNLFLAQRLGNNVGGTDHLRPGTAVEVSPDGRFLYLAAEGSINLFEREAQSGLLTLLEVLPANISSDMISSPDFRHLYALDEISHTLEAYGRDEHSGRLQLIETHQDGLRYGHTRPTAFSPNGRLLAITNPIEVNRDGATIFTRETSSGRLNLWQLLDETSIRMRDLLDMAFSPDGRFLYWYGRDPASAAVFARFAVDSSSPHLTFIEAQSWPGFYPSVAFAISPDGLHAYATITSNNDYSSTGESIAVFSRDLTSGALTLIDNTKFEGWHRGVTLTIAPNGVDFYATIDDASGHSGMLVMFTRSPETGRLMQRKSFQSWRDGVYALAFPFKMKLSFDGAFLYVLDQNGIATFATGRSNATGVAEKYIDQDRPVRYSLSQNYPNPFNPSTTIGFDLPQAGRVKLAVYNLTGELVSLLANGNFATGSHRVKFDASGLASGIYFYRLEGEGFMATRKLALVR